ncbi:hypothetical protein C8A05DRAFT_14320 [Staphylotrichum tortipilum]|uniref:F-box domain-containing protein n=1 Tax=Staphylotrichum tortipilum TaxID=2831512 RepID=A0AAN6RUA8_9PEZI|nr:hypothetical protein C8A05DRAFT_14320 [Staphylotrichum longicolle]
MAAPLFQLLLLPSDILSYLAQHHLSPPSAVALSLTCKGSYNLLFPHLKATDRLPFSNPEHRGELCLLLERDIGDKYYFCGACSSLHLFLPTDGPAAFDFGLLSDAPVCRGPDSFRWTLGVDRYTLGVHHVRLAMNHYLFGPPSGLALDNFDVNYLTEGHPRISESWSAKILDGDLFIASTRTTVWGLPHRELLEGLMANEYRICEHIGLHEAPTLLPRGNRGAIEVIADDLGHCRNCFTDWTITTMSYPPVMQDTEGDAEGKQQTRWRLALATYHRFPSSRKKLLSTPSDPRFDYDVEVEPMYRDAGLVRDIWLGRAKKSAIGGRWVRGGFFRKRNERRG